MNALLAIGFICLPQVAEKSVAVQDPRTALWESTVRITDKDGSSQGTGVIIGYKGRFYYVLTARHVVAGMNDPRVEWYSSSSYPLPATPKMKAHPMYRSDTVDLAVVRFEYLDPAFFLPATPIFKEPIPREKVFPIAKVAKLTDVDLKVDQIPVVSVGCTDGEPPSCQDDTTIGKKLKIENERPMSFYWETRKESKPGRSGGPLFDKEGRVVGICVARQKQLGYYTHADEIHAFLKNGDFIWIFDSTSSTIRNR